MARRTERQPELGTAIREARARAGLNQTELGERADINRVWINRIEGGNVNPAYGTLRRISQALGVPLSKVIARAEALERGED